MAIWEPNLRKRTFTSGTEGPQLCNLVTMFVEKAPFKNLDSFSISWIFFFLHEKKITLVNMLLKKFAASYVSYVRLQYELAWLDVNRVTLEERRCQGKKIYYHSTIPLLHTLNYTYLLLSQYLTMVTFLLFSCPHHMVIPLLASAFNMFLFILWSKEWFVLLHFTQYILGALVNLHN